MPVLKSVTAKVAILRPVNDLLLNALALVRATAFFAVQALFRHARSNGSTLMIRLSQLNGESFILNAELIRYVEARPDTFITLTTGERIVVREPMDEVLERAVRYQQSKFLIPVPHPPVLRE